MGILGKVGMRGFGGDKSTRVCMFCVDFIRNGKCGVKNNNVTQCLPAEDLGGILKDLDWRFWERCMMVFILMYYVEILRGFGL